MSRENQRSWVKWLVVLIVLAAAGGAGAWYYLNNREGATEYQIAAVERGDLTQVVTATGQLGPVVNVQVGSQISGIIKKLNVDYNSVVKSNQVIAEIDPATYEVNVLKAEAQLANSQANLALAKVQADRADSLFTNSLISSSDHDTAIAQLQQAQAQVKSDDANLKNAQVQLSYCTIFAPVDGVVISRNVDVGQTVAASFNTPTLFIIANDLGKMQIDALVSEADIGSVAVNQDVNFSVDAYPYRTFHGKVSQIRYGAITNQSVVTYDAVIGVNNADLKLLPGMTANVSIVIAQRENALKIPNAALRFHPPDAVTEPKTNHNEKMMAQNSGTNSGIAEGGGGSGKGPGGPMGPGGMGPGGFGARPNRGMGGGPGAPGGNRPPRPERQLVRTVYVMPANVDGKNANESKPKPVQIKVGISDGISTEVIDGLNESDQIAVGIISGDTGARAGAPANPFGGGGFRRF